MSGGIGTVQITSRLLSNEAVYKGYQNKEALPGGLEWTANVRARQRHPSASSPAPAEEFLSRIKRLEVEADEVMVSFDVISLFTSIPPALAIDTIDGFLREKCDETDQQLKRIHIIQLL
ncbi:hypothetical protein SprV_0501748000 [Sparganum proliferum]